MQLTDRTWAEIHLDRLAHNFKTLGAGRPEGYRFLAPVKADAYGHGAIQVSHLLRDLGCDYLGVACLSEAMELREAGIILPILIFGYTPPTDARLLAEQRLTQTIVSLEQAKGLSHALKGSGLTLSVHLKLDSGMGRLGFPCRQTPPAETLAVLQLPHLHVEGAFTHFAVSDMDDDDYTRGQLGFFMEAVDWIEAQSGQVIPLRHAANSGGVLRFPEAHQGMIRPGIALYGCSPNPELAKGDLQPVMELKTRIAQVRDFPAGDCVSYGRTYKTTGTETIAALPIGYADGLPRNLSGRMDMLLHGEFVPQVGRICMDTCMLNVSALKKVSVGDVVTVFGHDGDKTQTAHDVAELAGTISYEILARMGPRTQRVYVRK